MTMQKSVLVGVIGMVLGVLAAPARAEDRREIDGLTFALPAGWKFELQGPDHARLTHQDKKRYCIATLYASRAAGRDLDAEFANEWKAIGGDAAHTPTPARRKVAGRTLLEATTSVTVDGTNLLQRIALIDGGGQITTIVVFTANADAARVYQKQVDAIVTSIRFPSAPVAAAAPPPAPPPAAPPTPQGATRPDRVLVGTMKPSVTMADLAGSWNVGDGSVVGYVDASNGNYAGTSTSFYGEQYSIKSTGTFDFLFVGRANNTTVREKDTGTVVLSGGLIIFAFKGTRGTKTYQLITFVDQPSGASVLSLTPVGKDGKGNSAPWIANNCGVVKGVYHCVGGTEWVRRPSTTKN